MPRRALSRGRAFLRGARGALAPLQGWQNAKPRRSAPSRPTQAPRLARRFPPVAKSARLAELAAAPGGSRWPRTPRCRHSRVGPRAPSRRGALSVGPTRRDGDLEELAGLRSAFVACEPLKAPGAQEVHALWAELRVLPADAEAGSGGSKPTRLRLTFQEFALGFRWAGRGGRRLAWGPREPGGVRPRRQRGGRG